MNSKESLRELCSRCYVESDKCTCHSRYKGGKCKESCEHRDIILKDLDRLEKLEKENQELRKSIKSWNENAGNLLKENTKLKDAIKILNDKFELFIFEVDNIRYIGNEYAVGQLSQEESKVLNEVIKEKIVLKEIKENEN